MEQSCEFTERSRSERIGMSRQGTCTNQSEPLQAAYRLMISLPFLI